MIKKDSILEEVRRVREALAARCDYDPAKIAAEVRRMVGPGLKTVRRPPKVAKRTRRAS